MSTSVLANQDVGPRVLGAYFHLEPLIHEDAERLERACDRLADALGDELRWSASSFRHGVRPYRRRDLDYILGSTVGLVTPAMEGSTVERITAANLAKIPMLDYHVRCKGGDDPGVASPVSLTYWSDVPEVDGGDRYQVYAVLSFTVPEVWPLDRFRALVVDTAAELRLRWGNAGWTYTSWDVYDIATAPKARYAHAQRYLGFDVGEHVRSMRQFHRRMRTVSWLTVLGPSLVGELTEAQHAAIQASPFLSTAPVGAGLVIEAGARPEEGDRNRLEYPRGYMELDRILRPQRAAGADGAIWLGPWDEASIRAWLCRFEIRLA
jgi:hypothetical protein